MVIGSVESVTLQESITIGKEILDSFVVGLRYVRRYILMSREQGLTVPVLNDSIESVLEGVDEFCEYMFSWSLGLRRLKKKDREE